MESICKDFIRVFIFNEIIIWQRVKKGRFNIIFITVKDGCSEMKKEFLHDKPITATGIHILLESWN